MNRSFPLYSACLAGCIYEKKEILQSFGWNTKYRQQVEVPFLEGNLLRNHPWPTATAQA